MEGAFISFPIIVVCGTIIREERRQGEGLGIENRPQVWS